MSHLLQLNTRHTAGRPATGELELSFDARQKSRFRATLVDGREVGVMLPRGQGLRDGELLEAEDGTVIVVRARPESVSRVVSSDVLLLSRAAYHLGNRHMPVQILPGELRYHHDYVLDDMLKQLGLSPTFADLPFEPESGAYGSGHSFASHPHYHSHGHSHGESHAHEHGESHAHESEHSPEHSHDHPHIHDIKHPFVQQQPRVRLPGEVSKPSGSPHRAGVIHTNWKDDESSGSNQ